MNQAGCSILWLPFLRPIVLLFTILGPAGVDDMVPGASGTPRMVLRPDLCLGLCPDPTPGVLRTADTGQSPTHGGSLAPRHTATITKVGITRSDLQSQSLLYIFVVNCPPCDSEVVCSIPSVDILKTTWYPISPKGKISNLQMQPFALCLSDLFSTGCCQFLLKWS